MKIYIQDNDWCGCIVVIADNKEEALGMMKGSHVYDSNKDVEEMEIVPGIVLENFGDL